MIFEAEFCDRNHPATTNEAYNNKLDTIRELNQLIKQCKRFGVTVKELTNERNDLLCQLHNMVDEMIK